MRAFIVLLGMVLAWPALAQPTVDGSATGTVSGGTTITATLTTTQTNDVIQMAVTGGTTVSGGTPITFTVSGCGLTWASRKRSAGLTSTNVTVDVELWWAPSTAIQTGCVITATADRTIDDAVAVAWGTHGAHSIAAPFDTNAGLPVANPNLTTSTPQMGATFSTTEAHDLAVVIVGGTINTAPGSTSPLTPGSLIQRLTNAGGTHFASMIVASWSETTTLSAHALNMSGSAANFIAIGDAITADAAPVIATGHFFKTFP